MKRSKLNCMFDDKELEVAEILLDLRHLVFRPQQSPTLICNWGVKRRRTAIDQDDAGDSVKATKKIKPPPELNSPSTPLSLPLSESESKRSRRKFSHRSKPELLGLMDELKQCKEQLTKEVNVVRAYYQKILTENSNLKAQQKRAYSEKGSKNRGLRIGGSNQTQATNEHPRSMYPVESSSQVLAEKADGPFRCPDLNLTPSGPIDTGIYLGSFRCN